MTIHIGIDLGTTNTLVASEVKGKMKLYKFGNSNMLKSALFYDSENDEIIVGDKALKKGALSSSNLIKSSKTFMGDFQKQWHIGNRIFTPTDVAMYILTEVKNKVLSSLKSDEDEDISCVITVPAYFTSNQIDETKKAGKMAGLNIKAIISEPVSAAIAYSQTIETDETLFVLDLGGGTFDVSILKATNSTKMFDTLAVDGDHRLGGDDFDEMLFQHFLSLVQKDTGLDFSSFQRSGLDDYEDYLLICLNLKKEAENVKIALSEELSYEASISNLFYTHGKDYHFNHIIHRNDFNNVCKPLLDKIRKITQKCLNESGLKVSDINRIVLVGGSSYIPAVAEIAEEIFHKKPYSDEDLSSLVVAGATLYASPKGIQTSINDIISHSLGIEVFEKGKAELEKILYKNQKYPCEASKTFSTVSDYQEEVSINVWEGEIEADVNLNEFYGGFVLDGIEKAKAGIPEISVTFSFDSDRILTVTAKDLKTQVSKTVQVQKGQRLESNKSKPIDFVVMIDTSGSMSGNPIQLAKNACINLVNDMIDLNYHRLGLISFGSASQIISDLSQDKVHLISKIQTINTSGQTNMTAAFHHSADMLKSSTNSKICILVTDGYPDCSSDVLSVSKKVKEKDIRCITIGAGDIDKNFLMEVASAKTDFHYVNDMSGLKNVFENVINSLQR